MNRRTFIKVTGIVSLLGLTNLSFAEKEIKWIDAEIEKPKHNQRIIRLSQNSYYKGTYTISVGKYDAKMDNDKYKFALHQEFRTMKNVSGRKVTWVYPDVDSNESKNVKWLKADETMTAAYKGTGVMFKDTKYKNIYWMPINKLPKELPTFPKDNRPEWIRNKEI